MKPQGGDSVIKSISEAKIDLVLLDINMPGMDGIETLSQIKQNIQTSKIPVAMISASTMYEIKEKCKKLDVDNFFSKLDIVIKTEEKNRFFEFISDKTGLNSKII